MNIPSTVRTSLANAGGRYKLRTAPADLGLTGGAAAAEIPLDRLAKAVVLRSGTAHLMAIVPGDREIDLDIVNKLFKREFTVCVPEDLEAFFPKCDPHYVPPLAEPFGLKAILDPDLLAPEEVYFAVGVPGAFVRAQANDFARLQVNSWKKCTISKKGEADPLPSEDDPKAMYRERVQAVDKLPTMPGLAAEIIRVRNNPFANASELAAIIEQDPSLSAQVIRYALSPLYGYQGKVESVEQAIARVLGMDFVLDIAFGLALGRSFQNPKEGPLGLVAFWDHAIKCASLVQALCNAIDYNRRPAPGVGYLAGLLHNFGFLLLGHLFPTQFERLNKAVVAHPERSISELEREEIGVSHNELGLWLMDAWDMPVEIVEAVREHHNPEHRSDFSDYANLVYVANVLLKRHGIGDAETMTLPVELLQHLGLDELKAEVALANVLESRDGLEFMARKMAA